MGNTSVILDKYPEDTLEGWLEISGGTAWRLKLAIGKQCGKGESDSHWLFDGDMVFDDLSGNGFYDFGLILIPSCEDIATLKEIQEKLEPLNLPDSSSRAWKTSYPPPIDNRTIHMRAESRLEAYKLMGPHNTPFQQVAVYKRKGSTFSRFRELKTTKYLQPQLWCTKSPFQLLS